MNAPFSYFGAKSAIASTVWELIGNPAHYIEPFFGSGAVLLNRPNYKQGKSVETVCDKDGFLANVWRSLQFSPEETAKWCDWPVNHADLSARKKALINNEDRLLQNLVDNEKWHDPIMAGYWIWSASCWIGSGMTRIKQIPNLANAGKGVHRIGKRPDISDTGKGVHKIGQIPRVGNTGEGVHKIRKIPQIISTDDGVQSPYNTNIYKWFRELSERLRYVRVVCGDWTRVCGGNWQNIMGDVGIFFDPPYGVKDLENSLYHCDSIDISKDVMAWCIDRGKIETYRIVLCGYNEYEELAKYGWKKTNWIARGGYANLGKGRGMINRYRETIWSSPHCLKTELF